MISTPTITGRDQVFSMVVDAFGGDKEKARLWMVTPNPMLGGVSPDFMLHIGREQKLLQFVIDARQNSCV